MITTISNNLSPLCYLPCGKLVCYKLGDIILLNKGKIEKTFHVFNSKKERKIGKFNYIYRLLRMGIRTAEAIDDNTIVVSIGNMLYEFDLNKGTLSDGYFIGEGLRPLIFTSVKRIKDFEDAIYFGGYLSNMPKNPVNIYKRVGQDKWEVVYTFKQGEINHVHALVDDHYRNCVWIYTGDFDESAAIWKATDNFKTVERVACNDQKYRGCVAYALPEGLLYATDAPFADNFIYLMNTTTLETTKIFPISGSCIYGCKLKEKFVFSSTVEGDGINTSRFQFYFGRKRGAGIKDKYVHLYAGNLQNGFKEIYKEEKDCMPLYTFQFGVFKFPYGVNISNTLYFQPVATNKNDLNLLAYQSQ